MRFPVRVGRGVGLFAVALSLLGAASMQALGQVAASHAGLPGLSTTAQSNPIPLAFAQSAFPNATVGVFFNSSVQAVGGSGLLAMTVTGDLPPGLAVELGANTVAVEGVPTQAGQYTLQISIRDANGAALQNDFTIQVFSKTLQTMSQSTAPIVTDNETFHFNDAENVFFPVVITDVEKFNFTDKESDMDAVVVVDNESLHLTDTVIGLDAVVVFDNEGITLTDNLTELNSALDADVENMKVSDAVTVNLFNLPTITWATPAAIPYGTALSGTQLNASASFNGTTVPGTFAYTPAAGTVLAGGLQTLSVTFTPLDTADYTTATATVQLQVNGPANLLTPVAGSTLTGASATFTWAPIAGATEYILFLGSTGVGSSNLSGKVTTAATLTINNLPLNGETIYARLWTYFGNVKTYNDYTFTAASPAALTSPAQAATLTGSGQTFTWTPVAGATSYDLFLGSTGVGSVNLAGKVTTATTLTVNNLPLNGETVYVRLQTNFNGILAHNDYTFTASTPAALTSPTPGVTFNSPTQTFTWTPAVGATNYALFLGSTGVGSTNLYGKVTTAATLTANYLPVNGEKIYARLQTNFNGILAHIDYTFTALSPAALTAPTPGATLTDASQAFSWTPIAGTYNYTLWLGSTGVGSSDLYNSHTTGGTLTASGLPTNGEKIYARLFTNFSGVSGYTDSTFTAVAIPAALTSPAQGATFASSSQTFTWAPVTGATSYSLWLGSTGVGSSNLYGKVTTATTLTAQYLPVNGETIYARLLTNYNGVWVHTDYTFTAQ